MRSARVHPFARADSTTGTALAYPPAPDFLGVPAAPGQPPVTAMTQTQQHLQQQLAHSGGVVPGTPSWGVLSLATHGLRAAALLDQVRPHACLQVRLPAGEFGRKRRGRRHGVFLSMHKWLLACHHHASDQLWKKEAFRCAAAKCIMPLRLLR